MRRGNSDEQQPGTKGKQVWDALTLTKDSELAISGPSTVRRATKLRDVNPKARISRWTSELLMFAFSDVTCMELIYACHPDRITSA
jgi:hypothetical protein